VTVELARRLVERGMLLSELEAALLLVVVHGIPLSDALVEVNPSLLSSVQRELEQAELLSVPTVSVAPELYARLPAGMCRRLSAVPVQVDPRSGRVDIAAVQPLDPHVAREFAYHLDQPVRVLRAPREGVRAALTSLQQTEKVSARSSRGASSLGSEAPIPLVRVDKGRSEAPIPLVRVDKGRSEAPIPLLRRSMLAQRSRSGPAGGWSGAPEPLAEVAGAGASWRPKPPPADLLASADAEAARLEAALPAQAELADARSARERLELASSPEAVLEVLQGALSPAECIVFAVKSASFDGRVASPAVDQRVPAKSLSLLARQPSVLESALESGFYLGPVPNTPNHRELRDALTSEGARDVYVTVVTVSERPSLVWLIAGFEQSLDLTRRADEIAAAAGRALARILRERKRGN
jgi:Type II secretion system (T2SS), protein E, N-terminal domain